MSDYLPLKYHCHSWWKFSYLESQGFQPYQTQGHSTGKQSFLGDVFGKTGRDSNHFYPFVHRLKPFGSGNNPTYWPLI